MRRRRASNAQKVENKLDSALGTPPSLAGPITALP